MRSLLFSLLLLLAGNSFSQANQPYSFLIVQVVNDLDENKQMYYASIQQYGIDQDLNELLNLVPYNRKTIKANPTMAFYDQRSDTSSTFFNYFRKGSSEVLQFISSKGWELFSVIANVTAYGGEISTTPVYYFRKPAK